MINIDEREDITPICPHCNTRLEKMFYRELSSVFGRRYVYFCAYCEKVLGVSHRKGFWMG